MIGFKCFMCPSGVDEFPFVDEEEIRKAVKVLENTDTVLAVRSCFISPRLFTIILLCFLVPRRKRRGH